MDVFGKSLDVRRMTRDHCPHCHSADITQEMIDVYDGFGLSACGACQLRFTNPRPVDDDIAKLYEGREAGMDLATDSALKFALKSTKVHYYVKSLLKRMPVKPSFSVLDIGCGDGLISYGFSKIAGCARSVGSDFDPVPPPTLAAHGLDYVPYGELFTPAHQAAYDIVIMRHVLEHVPQPQDFINRAMSLLKPGGYLCVEVPDYRSHWRRLFGRHYNQLVIPYHLTHFTPATLAPLFNGHHIVALYGANVPVIGPSLGKLLGIRVSHIGLTAAALYAPQIILDRLLGNYTAMVAIVRKDAA